MKKIIVTLILIMAAFFVQAQQGKAKLATFTSPVFTGDYPTYLQGTMLTGTITPRIVSPDGSIHAIKSDTVHIIISKDKITINTDSTTISVKVSSNTIINQIIK